MAPLGPILDALAATLPARRPLALHEPQFDGSEWRHLKACLDSGWVSSVGEYVERFERGLADYTGAARAVATVNGTAALQVALRLAGVGADDEVLCPSLTFVATANAIRYLGATPHFVDADPQTLGVDPVALAEHLERIVERRDGQPVNRTSGRPLRALVVVHVLGHPARIDALAELAAGHGLTLVEDIAESLGSRYHGRHTGRWGRLAALSCNGNKVITTGGGGAILTDDTALADRARHLTTTAKRPHRWAFDHDAIGYNYRLPNLNAALGVAQLEGLDTKLARKRALADRYRAAFAGLAGVRLFDEPDGARSNHWLNLLLLDDPALRDPLLAATNDAGLLTRPFWTPLHRLAIYADAPRAPLPVTESLAARGVCLPSSPGL